MKKTNIHIERRLFPEFDRAVFKLNNVSTEENKISYECYKDDDDETFIRIAVDSKNAETLFYLGGLFGASWLKKQINYDILKPFRYVAKN